MAIISQETFDKFTEGEKRIIREDYKNSEVSTRIRLEAYFGKKNLLLESSEIKTWKDVELNVNERYCKLDLALGTIFPTFKDDKLRLKIKATYKISKLIELGYGGIVTKEEWRDKEISKWFIAIGIDGRLEISNSYENWQEFISFHTKEQVEEFMSYPENVELVKQYKMFESWL